MSRSASCPVCGFEAVDTDNPIMYRAIMESGKKAAPAQPASAHTAGRLHFKGDHSLTIDGKLVATTWGPDREANAARLALCFNLMPEAVDIIQRLIDLQNGCPLPKYEKGFEQTNAEAAALLAKLTA